MNEKLLKRILKILNENPGIVIHIAVGNIPVSLEYGNGGNSLKCIIHGRCKEIGKSDGTFKNLYQNLMSLAQEKKAIYSIEYIQKIRSDIEW